MIDSHKIVCTVDDRENNKIISVIKNEFALPPLYQNRLKTEMNVKRIDIGDYIITEEYDQNEENISRVLAVIERKTLADYNASFKDNRHENKEKMIKLRTETKCIIYYLIEGPHHPKYETKYAGISYGNILASSLDLQIQDDIHVIRTKNMNESAKLLKFMCENYARLVGNENFILGNFDEGANLNNILKKCDYTAEEKLQKNLLLSWSSLKGIGAKLKLPLAKSFTLSELINGKITKDTLLDIKDEYNIKLTSIVINMLTSELSYESQLKLLTTFPRISKKGALILLENISIEKIINHEYQTEVANIKIGKNKFGKKKLENIYQLVNMKY